MMNMEKSNDTVSQTMNKIGDVDRIVAIPLVNQVQDDGELVLMDIGDCSGARLEHGSDRAAVQALSDAVKSLRIERDAEIMRERIAACDAHRTCESKDRDNACGGVENKARRGVCKTAKYCQRDRSSGSDLVRTILIANTGPPSARNDMADLVDELELVKKGSRTRVALAESEMGLFLASVDRARDALGAMEAEVAKLAQEMSGLGSCVTNDGMLWIQAKREHLASVRRCGGKLSADLAAGLDAAGDLSRAISESTVGEGGRLRDMFDMAARQCGRIFGRLRSMNAGIQVLLGDSPRRRDARAGDDAVEQFLQTERRQRAELEWAAVEARRRDRINARRSGARRNTRCVGKQVAGVPRRFSPTPGQDEVDDTEASLSTDEVLGICEAVVLMHCDLASELGSELGELLATWANAIGMEPANGELRKRAMSLLGILRARVRGRTALEQEEILKENGRGMETDEYWLDERSALGDPFGSDEEDGCVADVRCEEEDDREEYDEDFCDTDGDAATSAMLACTSTSSEVTSLSQSVAM
jgi:hypothetical protein